MGKSYIPEILKSQDIKIGEEAYLLYDSEVLGVMTLGTIRVFEKVVTISKDNRLIEETLTSDDILSNLVIGKYYLKKIPNFKLILGKEYYYVGNDRQVHAREFKDDTFDCVLTYLNNYFESIEDASKHVDDYDNIIRTFDKFKREGIRKDENV